MVGTARFELARCSASPRPLASFFAFVAMRRTNELGVLRGSPDDNDAAREYQWKEESNGRDGQI